MADVITRLKLESGEYDSKIKRATQGLLQMEQECRKVGGTLAVLEKDQLDYVRSLGNMETVSRNARGQLSELTAAFTELSMQYKRLTDEEKKGDYGKALNSSLSQLKTRINESKQQLADVSKELGETGVNMGKLGAEGLDLKSAMSTLGGQLGINTSLITGLSAGTMGAVAAIGALIAAEVKAAQAFAEYNEEIGKQSQVTTVTTGLSGGDAERMTTAARSLAKVYDTDFREVINAANTLMTQFGKSGDEAIELIRDGMQGMIMGDGPKLLSMIQQYAPSFRDAGIEASQLVAIIQNSEGGIFTDQNMNAIVMGIRNIRLMTKQTSEALAQLGIDGQKMSKQLNDGTLTIFDALQQVAGAIESVDSNSQAAGEVMQSVFGRQGTMAGTNLGKAIATLNTNLEDTKRQTGGVGQATAELEQATERLDKAIRNCFGYDGWLAMSNGIKTELTNAMAGFLDVVSKVDHVMESISGKGVFENLIETTIKALGPLGTLAVKLNDIFHITDTLISRFGDGNTSTPSTSKLPNLSNTGAWGTTLNRFAPQTSTMDDRPAPVATSASTSIKPIKTDPNSNKTPRIETETTAKELTIQQQINKLLEESYNADANRRVEIREEVRQLQEQLEAREKIREEILGINDESKKQEALQKKITEAVKERSEALAGNDLAAFYAADSKVAGAGGTSIEANGFTATESNIAAFIVNLREKIGRADVGTTLYTSLTSQLRDAEAFKSIIEKAVKNGITTADFNQNEIWKKIFTENGNIPNETWRGLLKSINDELLKAGFEPIKLTATLDYSEEESEGDEYNDDNNTESSKKKSKREEDEDTDNKNKNKKDKGDKQKVYIDTESLSKLTGGISSMVSGIEGLGVEIPQGLKEVVGGIQSVTQILSAIMSIVSVIQAVSAADAIIPFAGGGIVPKAAGGMLIPGNSFSGDNLRMPVAGGGVIGVNSGELILNRAQQDTIASALEQSDENALGGTPYVLGETIYIGLTNYLRRTGRGELITANR